MNFVIIIYCQHSKFELNLSFGDDSYTDMFVDCMLRKQSIAISIH